MRTNKVAIQGFEGSFHQIAAIQYFGERIEMIYCPTFRDVIKAATNKNESIGGVMAIENSIAGSIIPNYTLIEKSNLRISGEVYLEINQQLLVYPGVKIQDVKEVHSHPMALLQCMDFLEQHHWKLIETEDTALSAKSIQKKKSYNVAAIASSLAAELFDLEILVPNIHTEKNNYTRFLILQRADEYPTICNPNKASINFKTDHKAGSLSSVLTKIAGFGINLSKLQSMPIPGTKFRYSFYADLEFAELAQFQQAIQALEAITDHIIIYGVYKNGATE